jgi:hypothetical protein
MNYLNVKVKVSTKNNWSHYDLIIVIFDLWHMTFPSAGGRSVVMIGLS